LPAIAAAQAPSHSRLHPYSRTLGIVLAPKWSSVSEPSLMSIKSLTLSSTPPMAKPASSMLDLDGFDWSILALVQHDNAVPLRTLAEKVNLSTAAVQRRIKRLEEGGVTIANVAVVDPAKAGKPITIIAEVSVERTSSDALAATKASFCVPQVQQCYYVTGEADFVLVLNVASMQEYQDLAGQLFAENPNVKWFKTLVALDRVKVGLHVPV
jgi:Lrp/AsnC family transcriptional regulator, leucine-responsive regulatory protein